MSDKKYDVGIYGLWYGRNYGSIITYYALNEVVKSFGYTTAMIKNPLGREGLDLSKLTRSHSLVFADKHYDITPLMGIDHMAGLNEICDRFLLGSDQMWNYGLSRPYKQTYFFDFVRDDKVKVAYATSFGKEKYNGPEEDKGITGKNLKRMDAISVRDDFSKEICEKTFGVPAVINLDPVFLCDKKKYEELIEEASLDLKDFIFAYVLDPNREFGEQLKMVAKATGKKIVVIFNEGGDRESYRRALEVEDENFIFLMDATVEEWLYCYKNADFVITDSFHGSCFSIIFGKTFVVKKNMGRGGQRFDFLLGELGLKEYMVTTIGDIFNKFLSVGLNHKIDYANAYKVIEEKKQTSIAWLKKALSSKDSLLRAQNIKTVGNLVPVDKCTGCGACANVCPVGAITMKPNAEGFMNPVVDYNTCIDCGRCVSKCVALHPQYKNEEKPECYAFWAKDDIRKISSSGGVFTVAAEYILNQGGYVAGAVYRENYSVCHDIISDKAELWRMRGSKYMQSDVGDIYKRVKALLEQDKLVLFTGLPCQVAALYAYLGNKKYDKLYTIDLVCHGITSQKVFDKFHKDVLHGKKMTDLQFKAKEPWGWHAGTNVTFDDGTKYSQPLERCPYFIAYLKNISKNRTCGQCQFNRLPRQADLSIGDFWGINNFNPAFNDKKGTSEVLVNNAHGAALLEKLRPESKLLESAPLDVALKGNHVMVKPYGMHRNRDFFFQNLDRTNFAELTMKCFRDTVAATDGTDNQALQSIEENRHGIYFLAKIVAQNYGGRKIVGWGNGPVFREVLKKTFNLDIDFTVFADNRPVNGTTVRAIEDLRGKSADYYVVSLAHPWSVQAEKILTDMGYQPEKDFIFRVHKPIVLENFDLSKGRYVDIYGNTISGASGVLKKVVFRGLNSHIELGNRVQTGSELEFDLGTNGKVTVGEGTRFIGNVRFQLLGNNPARATVTIGQRCRFLSGLIKLYGHSQNSAITIGDGSTFESNLELHANSGKKLTIGKDCMFSHNVDVWAGDGHTIFDVVSGKNTNSDYNNLPAYKNEIVLGNHIWVSKGAFILAGTHIGTGSVVGAQSVVKGSFPNNCVVAGNPARDVKHNVAWSRDMTATDIKSCGSQEYIALTSSEDTQSDEKSEEDDINRGKENSLKVWEKIEESKIQHWLVTGGSTGLGRAMVLRLHELGYKVAATSRDVEKLRDLPEGIVKIQLDVKDINSCRNAVEKAVEKMGRIDVLVNNAGLSHTSTFEETPDYIAENIMETNYWGVSNMIKAILPYMRENKNGTIINISSASGFRARKYGSYYVASKFAVDNLTKNLKFECQRFMRFMAVELGGFNTGLMQRQTVIHSKIDEYKNLPPLYPFKKGYSNRLGKAIQAIIDVANHKELPRDLILGWDAYQQFPQAMQVLENETEAYKNISISTDEAKRKSINVKDLILPRNKNLKIQNWLITGASEGFGRVLALRLHDLGYTVTVTSRDMSKLTTLPEDIHKIESQLDSFDACNEVINTGLKMMGSIDVLVNNATSNCWSSFEECPEDIMKKVFYVNYTLPQNMIKAFLPHMREAKNGTVVNITSIAGIQPRARVSTYSAAKAALEGLTRCLKAECQRFGRFMAVELVCMGTRIMRHNPVLDSKVPEYQKLGRYTQEINNIPNRKDVTAQQIINVVNQNEIPQSLLIGTESYLIAKNELKRARSEFEEYKEITLSVCDKTQR